LSWNCGCGETTDEANLADVEAKAERHLRQHQVQRSVDVVDAQLIQRLAPVHQPEHQRYKLQHTLCLRNISDIFDCNLNKNYQILIIFGVTISDTTCRQMTT